MEVGWGGVAGWVGWQDLNIAGEMTRCIRQLVHSCTSTHQLRGGEVGEIRAVALSVRGAD